MTAVSTIELRALEITPDIGTFNPGETRPETHILDLTLTVDSAQVLIHTDSMDQVFDYDPLVAHIDRLARDRHYETQESLVTRILGACADHRAIKAAEVYLRKAPVLNGSGSLGVRVKAGAAELDDIRSATPSA